MAISVQAFWATLPIMGKGMLGIFAVMAVIYLLIWALDRATARGGGAHED